jgi:hypothetical protein
VAGSNHGFGAHLTYLRPRGQNGRGCRENAPTRPVALHSNASEEVTAFLTRARGLGLHSLAWRGAMRGWEPFRRELSCGAPIVPARIFAVDGRLAVRAAPLVGPRSPQNIGGGLAKGALEPTILLEHQESVVASIRRAVGAT